MFNGQIYIVEDLTNTFQQWRNLDTNFIGKYIFPEVPVDKEMFYVWSSGYEHLTIPTSTLRFGRAKAPESTYSNNTILKGPLNEHALSSFITKREYDLASSVINVEAQRVERIASQMELVDENALATTLANSSVITHNVTLSGGAQWSDHGNSNPFADITNAVVQQQKYSPMPANTCWMSLEVWLQIINHPDFLARLGLAQDRVMTEQGFLKLLSPYGIEKVYIGRAKYNSAAEGQTKNLQSVWGKHFWTGFVTDTPGVEQVNGGYKFALKGARYVTREQKVNPMGSELIDVDTYDYELLSADVYFGIFSAVA